MRKNIFLIYFIVITVLNLPYCFANIVYKPKNTPKIIKYYVETHIKKHDKNYKVVYIMNWKGSKVYRIISTEKGVIMGGAPTYFLLDGNNVRIPTKEEDRELQLDVLKYCNNKRHLTYLKLEKILQKNAHKRMEIADNTPPPEIPPVIITYADKYMLKGKDRKIFYLMDWNSQHVYRTYWLRYGLLPVPASIILYDGYTIRRPTQEEFKQMRLPMDKALLKRAMELRHQDNKD